MKLISCLLVLAVASYVYNNTCPVANYCMTCDTNSHCTSCLNWDSKARTLASNACTALLVPGFTNCKVYSGSFKTGDAAGAYDCPKCKKDYYTYDGTALLVPGFTNCKVYSGSF